MSKSEARRKIKEGAVRIDGVRVTDPDFIITRDYIERHNFEITLSVGKHNHCVVAWV